MPGTWVDTAGTEHGGGQEGSPDGPQGNSPASPVNPTGEGATSPASGEASSQGNRGAAEDNNGVKIPPTGETATGPAEESNRPETIPLPPSLPSISGQGSSSGTTASPRLAGTGQTEPPPSSSPAIDASSGDSGDSGSTGETKPSNVVPEGNTQKETPESGPKESLGEHGQHGVGTAAGPEAASQAGGAGGTKTKSPGDDIYDAPPKVKPTGAGHGNKPDETSQEAAPPAGGKNVIAGSFDPFADSAIRGRDHNKDGQTQGPSLAHSEVPNTQPDVPATDIKVRPRPPRLGARQHSSSPTAGPSRPPRPPFLEPWPQASPKTRPRRSPEMATPLFLPPLPDNHGYGYMGLTKEEIRRRPGESDTDREIRHQTTALARELGRSLTAEELDVIERTLRALAPPSEPASESPSEPSDESMASNSPSSPGVPGEDGGPGGQQDDQRDAGHTGEGRRPSDSPTQRRQQQQPQTDGVYRKAQNQKKHANKRQLDDDSRSSSNSSRSGFTSAKSADTEATSSDVSPGARHPREHGGQQQPRQRGSQAPPPPTPPSPPGKEKVAAAAAAAQQSQPGFLDLVVLAGALVVLAVIITQAALQSLWLTAGVGAYGNGGYNGLRSVVIFHSWSQFVLFILAVTTLAVGAVKVARVRVTG